MTFDDFNAIRRAALALPPAQMRQLCDAIDRKLAALPAASPASEQGDTIAKPIARDNHHRQMLADGLLSQLPDIAQDYDDPDDEPVEIKGEPLSETIIRERR